MSTLALIALSVGGSGAPLTQDQHKDQRAASSTRRGVDGSGGGVDGSGGGLHGRVSLGQFEWVLTQKKMLQKLESSEVIDSD